MLPKGRHHPHKWVWLWSRDCSKNFAVYHDATRCAGSSATAALLVIHCMLYYFQLRVLLSAACWTIRLLLMHSDKPT